MPGHVSTSLWRYEQSNSDSCSCESLLEHFLAQSMLNRSDVLLHGLQLLAGDHCNLIRIETFNEVKLEDVALGPRPILDGSLEVFQEVLFRRNFVRRHGVKIGQEAFSFHHGRFELLLDDIQGPLGVITADLFRVIWQNLEVFERDFVRSRLPQSTSLAAELEMDEEVEPYVSKTSLAADRPLAIAVRAGAL
jgi:hypothetical protein